MRYELHKVAVDFFFFLHRTFSIEEHVPRHALRFRLDETHKMLTHGENDNNSGGFRVFSIRSTSPGNAFFSEACCQQSAGRRQMMMLEPWRAFVLAVCPCAPFP